MSKFFVSSQPYRMSPTGYIHLAQHIDEFFPSCTYTNLVQADDGYTNFGVLEGSGTDFSRVLEFCSKGFNLERIFKDELIGAMALYFTDEIDPETEEVTKTLTDVLNAQSITFIDSGDGTVDKVAHAKIYKMKEFKAICKNEFNDYNDIFANLTKTILLLNEYKVDLTTEQSNRLDTALVAMKSIYSVDTCLAAMEFDISTVSNIMPGYYTAKDAVENMTTLEDIKAAIYK